MLRMLGRRSVRRSVRRGRREREVRPVRVRRGEMSTAPPDKLTKHLLPCHVRLLDGTDLYCQLPVSGTDQRTTVRHGNQLNVVLQF